MNAKPRLPPYTFTIDDKVLVLIDLKHGVSITNGVEAVLRDLHWHMQGLNGYRIIYRDTNDDWEGIAHCGAVFLGFVPLRERSRQAAIDRARAIPAADWPIRTE
jgi:hypothetical protein